MELFELLAGVITPSLAYAGWIILPKEPLKSSDVRLCVSSQFTVGAERARFMEPANVYCCWLACTTVAPADGAVPAGEEPRVAGDLPAQRGFIHDVLGAFQRDRSDGRAGGRAYGDELIGDGQLALRDARGKLPMMGEDASFEDGELGAGV